MKKMMITAGIILAIALLGSFTEDAPQWEVSVSPEKLGPFQPQKVQGDCELGSNVFCEVKLKLYLSSDRQSLVARTFFIAWEPDMDQSKGVYSGRTEVYRAPTGYKIKAINGDRFWQVTEYKDHSENSPEKKFLLPNESAPWFVEVNARRSGEELCEEEKLSEITFIPTGQALKVELEVGG
jgi:hypothetical protein